MKTFSVLVIFAGLFASATASAQDFRLLCREDARQMAEEKMIATAEEFANYLRDCYRREQEVERSRLEERERPQAAPQPVYVAQEPSAQEQEPFRREMLRSNFSGILPAVIASQTAIKVAEAMNGFGYFGRFYGGNHYSIPQTVRFEGVALPGCQHLYSSPNYLGSTWNQPRVVSKCQAY